jgi:hypothetical protein
MSDTPWKITDWNVEIIQPINTLAQSPDQGCDPISPLDEVADPHKWSKADISAAQNKLLAICDENTFGATPDLWKQSIVDELNSAIGRGWCGCQEECPPSVTEEIFRYFQPYTTVLLGRGPQDPCSSPPPSDYFDYYAAAANVTSFGVGHGGGYNIIRLNWRDGVVTAMSYCYSNTFNAITGLQNPMPPPSYDGSGHLTNSSYVTAYYYCFVCNFLKWGCFLWFCNCTGVGIGTLCCPPPAPNVPYPCDCVMDPVWYASVDGFYAYQVEEATHSHEVTFEVRKWCT